ncbi:MAG: disulfide bond formation protein B [Mariprofundaceae bacterium]|nr:disulfide bond formation protein B [Mariprofundaceae bacterium]
MQEQTHNTAWTLIFVSWLIATFATLSSLFFSEIMHLEPCILCWYQRICIFPLALILLLGLFPLDKNIIKYALPFALIGLLFTLYHITLFYGFIPENLQPCSQGIPCDDDSMILFGFLPIPWLSLLGFGSIITLLLTAQSRMKS